MDIKAGYLLGAWILGGILLVFLLWICYTIKRLRYHVRVDENKQYNRDFWTLAGAEKYFFDLYRERRDLTTRIFRDGEQLSWRPGLSWLADNSRESYQIGYSGPVYSMQDFRSGTTSYGSSRAGSTICYEKNEAGLIVPLIYPIPDDPETPDPGPDLEGGGGEYSGGGASDDF